ncbi:uncharacterized protein [Nicotiana sylvestris]|uniref:uncharacterized protein n=1 Tax=Nicotiana sylvestris TaxID=4096 RepID=UPI00388CB8C9
MDTSYNFIIGRPWIHVAGVVPSTIHQMIKFDHGNQEIVVHGEDNSPFTRTLQSRVSKLEKEVSTLYTKTLKLWSTINAKKGPYPSTLLSDSSVMVIAEMIRHRYKPRKGLGVSQQGITEPITLIINEKFFGIGFQATNADRKWADECKKNGSNNVDVNNMTCLRTSCPYTKTLSNYEIINQEPKYDEDETFRKINRELEQFENKPKPNLNEIDLVNLGSPEKVREITISIHVDERTRDVLIHLLFEFKDVLAWSYDDILGLSIDLVDLNKASPKDNFCISKHHILVDNCAKHEIQSFVDCNAGYHQVLMDDEDSEKMTFTIPWEIEVYVDDVIIKSKTQEEHVWDLRKFFERLRIRKGIGVDPTKIKSIRDSPPPRTKKEVMSLLGRLNYIKRFIAKLTTTCEPIFKLLKKDAAIKWTDECQKVFDKIKEYLSNMPVLVPFEPGRPFFLYLTVFKNSFSCVLGKHNVTRKREQSIYYMSKKVTCYEAKYTLLERTCCALTWVA